jgi:hypothetical protein
LVLFGLGGLIQAIEGESDEDSFEVSDSGTGYHETICRDENGGIYNP